MAEDGGGGTGGVWTDAFGQPHFGLGLGLVLPEQEAALHVVGVEHKGRGRRAGDLAVELEPVVREELVEVGGVGDNAVKISALVQSTVRVQVCVAAARDNPGIRTLGGREDLQEGRVRGVRLRSESVLGGSESRH